MTAKKGKQSKATRNRYSPEFKAEALGLAQKVGVAAAMQQLGLHESQIYAERGKARQSMDQGEAPRQLAAENACLKRQLAEQAEELAILTRRQRTS